MSPIFIGVLNTAETRNRVKILIKYCLVVTNIYLQKGLKMMQDSINYLQNCNKQWLKLELKKHMHFQIMNTLVFYQELDNIFVYNKQSIRWNIKNWPISWYAALDYRIWRIFRIKYLIELLANINTNKHSQLLKLTAIKSQVSSWI